MNEVLNVSQKKQGKENKNIKAARTKVVKEN